MNGEWCMALTNLSDIRSTCGKPAVEVTRLALSTPGAEISRAVVAVGLCGFHRVERRRNADDITRAAIMRHPG